MMEHKHEIRIKSLEMAVQILPAPKDGDLSVHAMAVLRVALWVENFIITRGMPIDLCADGEKPDAYSPEGFRGRYMPREEFEKTLKSVSETIWQSVPPQDTPFMNMVKKEGH